MIVVFPDRTHLLFLPFDLLCFESLSQDGIGVGLWLWYLLVMLFLFYVIIKV